MKKENAIVWIVHIHSGQAHDRKKMHFLPGIAVCHLAGIRGGQRLLYATLLKWEEVRGCYMPPHWNKRRPYIAVYHLAEIGRGQRLLCATLLK